MTTFTAPVFKLPAEHQAAAIERLSKATKDDDLCAQREALTKGLAAKVERLRAEVDALSVDPAVAAYVPSASVCRMDLAVEALMTAVSYTVTGARTVSDSNT